MTSATPQHIGEGIRRRREQLGLSREGLAHFAGVSLRTIIRLEQGEHFPRRATQRVIEAALDEQEAA